MAAILDASALLAFLQGEPGGDAVRNAIQEGATISAVNLAEVCTALVDRGQDPAKMTGILTEHSGTEPGLYMAPFDGNLAFLAAELRPMTRSKGLSLGDRACLALGRSLKEPVLTADRSWVGLGLPVDITVIR